MDQHSNQEKYQIHGNVLSIDQNRLTKLCLVRLHVHVNSSVNINVGHIVSSASKMKQEDASDVDIGVHKIRRDDSVSLLCVWSICLQRQLNKTLYIVTQVSLMSMYLITNSLLYQNICYPISTGRLVIYNSM